ncbi:MAG: 30S ribosomal protein S14 [Nanoarchaeota archaeon]|nr:30S ribosomal protein S14 [Nanoarchaeota archaeon]
MKHNTPKKIKYGARVKRCSLSGNPHAYIQKYGLNLSRQAFRQIATKLGFKKYN